MMKNILLALLMACMMMACSKSSNTVEPTPEDDNITIASGTNLSPAFDVEGGTISISFTALKPWTASLVNNRADEWCRIEPTSGSAGSNTISIKVAPNEEPDDKSAVVQIKSGNATKTVNVSQKQKNALTLTSNKYEVDAKGGSVEIEVKANVKYSYSIAEAAKEWIVYESSRALTTSYLKFKISPNESLTTREGTITISDGVLSETVTIYQQEEKLSIIISQKEYTIGADADTIQVEVSSNVNVEMQMPGVNWIAENQSRAYSTNTYHFLVSANDTYDNRSVEIVFKNTENNLEEKVVVNQMQRNAIVLAKNEYTLEKEACHLDFNIQANVAFEVKVEGDWIKQVQSRGLESHSLYFDIAENTDDDEREGKIVISSDNIEQVIKVIQKGNTVDVEKIAEYVVEVSEKVDPLFMECETIEELATHLDKIKNMNGVADAWVTNTALFVETKGGFPLSWLYTPGFDLDEDILSSRMVKNYLNSLDITCRSVSDDEIHQFTNRNRVGIVNPIDHYDKHFECEELGELFSHAGFDVTHSLGKDADLHFFKNDFPTYDILFLITHGVYDGDTHWLMTGDLIPANWDLNGDGEVDLKEQFLRLMDVIVDIDYTEELGIGTRKIIDGFCAKHWTISEKFIKNKMRDFNQDAIIFNVACQSLKGNDSLTELLKEKNVKVYLGYDETNCQGYKAGIAFYENMLRGMTVEQALNHLLLQYVTDDCPNHEVKPHKANLKSALSDGNNVCIAHPIVHTGDSINTGSSYDPTNEVVLQGEIKEWRATLKGYAGFLVSTNVDDLQTHKFGEKIMNEQYYGDIRLSVALSGLEPNTTYYYQTYLDLTYVDMEGECFYGEVKSFTTGEVEPVTVVEAIDLGLSVLWASHNVGATKPEEYGGYYAWGETEEKEEYTVRTYKYYKGDLDEDGSMYDTKEWEDIGREISGTQYDVAHVLWGNGWRMPTFEECEEFYEKCTREYTEYNGIMGNVVTGPNGNSIFIPGTGYIDGKKDKLGGYVCFWSGSQWKYNGENAICGAWGMGKYSYPVDQWRYRGYPVRPVKDK